MGGTWPSMQSQEGRAGSTGVWELKMAFQSRWVSQERPRLDHRAVLSHCLGATSASMAQSQHGEEFQLVVAGLLVSLLVTGGLWSTFLGPPWASLKSLIKYHRCYKFWPSPTPPPLPNIAPTISDFSQVQNIPCYSLSSLCMFCICYGESSSWSHPHLGLAILLTQPLLLSSLKHHLLNSPAHIPQTGLRAPWCAPVTVNSPI